MLTRTLSAKASELASQFPALVITGARQTGKTTLVRDTFPTHQYVSLDLPSAAELAEKDPDHFLALHPPPLIIDEVQYAPGLFRHLKIAIDAHRHRHGQFILTGSQKFVLMKNVSDSLAGRCGLIELETLSLNEIAQNEIKPTSALALAQWMVRGGFPELWRNPSLNSNAFYRSYLATYLERDVRQILNVTSLRDFERFVRACAARSGQLLDKSGISRDVGISVKAVGDWLSVLEASNQIHLLEPYFSNLGKRLTKSPKLYFADAGLLTYLLGLDESGLLNSPYLGSVWEGAIFSELRKRRESSGQPWTLWFYRDSQQHEVDFVLSRGNHRVLLEAKWTENLDTRDTTNLAYVSELLQAKEKREQVGTWVVCRTPHISVMQNTRVIDIHHLGQLFI